MSWTDLRKILVYKIRFGKFQIEDSAICTTFVSIFHFIASLRKAEITEGI